MSQPRRALAAAALAAACAGACSPEGGAPPTKAAPRPAVAPSDAAGAGSAQVVSYSYDPANRRDPFRSFVRTAVIDDGDTTSPLERFDLSQLELSAIVWGIDIPRALIVDPSGKGYIVSTGAVLGKNKGRIISIEDNTIVVKETYVDSFDRATTKPVELRLRTTEGG